MIKDNFIINAIIELLLAILNRIKRGDCELTPEERDLFLSLIAHEPMSKVLAYKFLGLSRSQFDYLVSLGEIPEGLHRLGFKEKLWYKDLLIQYKALKEEDNENKVILNKKEK